MEDNRTGMSRNISPGSFKKENGEHLDMVDPKAELMQESPCISCGEVQEEGFYFGQKVPANAKLYFTTLTPKTGLHIEGRFF